MWNLRLKSSKGGFTSKINLRIDALGLPIAFAQKGGKVSEYKGYVPIMNADDPAPKVLLADKGHDADFIRADRASRSGVAMTSTNRNRPIQSSAGVAIYARHNTIERCFNKLKNVRRLATRFDKPLPAISASSTSSKSACGCTNLSTPPSTTLADL